MAAGAVGAAAKAAASEATTGVKGLAKYIRDLNIIEKLANGMMSEDWLTRNASVAAMRSIRAIGLGGTAGGVIGAYKGYRDTGTLGGALTGAGLGVALGVGAELATAAFAPQFMRDTGIHFGPFGRLYQGRATGQLLKNMKNAAGDRLVTLYPWMKPSKAAWRGHYEWMKANKLPGSRVFTP